MFTGHPCLQAHVPRNDPPLSRYSPMGLFKSDLLRSFALGFALGGIAIALVLGTNLFTGQPSLIGAATAAAPAR